MSEVEASLSLVLSAFMESRPEVGGLSLYLAEFKYSLWWRLSQGDPP